MTVTHRHRGELRLGRLYPEGYRDETSSRPFDAGLITESLMANAGHRGGTLCLKVRSIGEAITA